MKHNILTYQIKKLSALEMITCETHAKKLFKKLFNGDNESKELLTSLCEHASLCYFCLYQNNKRLFSSPFKVLQSISINELCDVYDAYQTMSNAEECEYNGSLESQLKTERFNTYLRN